MRTGYIAVLVYRLCAAAAAAHPMSSPADAERSGRATFLVIGDWGRRGSEGQRSVARAMARASAEHPPRFVLTTGDNFYEDGVASEDDAHWRESFESVYDVPELAVPWLVCLGNHDHRGDARVQLGYGARNRRWNLHEHYYAREFSLGGASLQVVVLDTTALVSRYRSHGEEPIAGVDELDAREQLHWLSSVLERSSARWTIVVGHHPVYSGSPFHGSNPELIAHLRPLLERRAVAAYLAGHEHDLQHLVQGGVDYLVSGAAAESRPTGSCELTRFCDPGPGFLAVDVERERLVYRFLDTEARELYRAERRAPILIR